MLDKRRKAKSVSIAVTCDEYDLLQRVAAERNVKVARLFRKGMRAWMLMHELTKKGGELVLKNIDGTIETLDMSNYSKEKKLC